MHECGYNFEPPMKTPLNGPLMIEPVVDYFLSLQKKFVLRSKA